MRNSNNTIVRQFWSHVNNMPDNTGFYARNVISHLETTIVPIMSPVTGGSVYTVNAPLYREISWLQAGHIVAEAMIFLKEIGFKKGDRAAILAWNSPEWVWLDLAIKSLGGTTVPIYPNSAGDQVNYILGDSGCKILFTDDQEQMKKVSVESGVRSYYFNHVLADTIDYDGSKMNKEDVGYKSRNLTPTNRSQTLVRTILSQLVVGGRLNDNFLGIKPQDLATLIYTSGSTGQPKGVIQLHSTIASA
ncbi:MAG TPA: AMP-binding protein, partial [Candidatus Melainabacteria bacterium]|nr:AMP-binding protein [Candidatus Melainabacteria bacterium]